MMKIIPFRDFSSQGEPKKPPVVPQFDPLGVKFKVESEKLGLNGQIDHQMGGSRGRQNEAKIDPKMAIFTPKNAHVWEGD